MGTGDWKCLVAVGHSCCGTKVRHDNDRYFRQYTSFAYQELLVNTYRRHHNVYAGVELNPGHVCEGLHDVKRDAIAWTLGHPIPTNTTDTNIARLQRTPTFSEAHEVRMISGVPHVPQGCSRYGYAPVQYVLTKSCSRHRCHKRCRR